MSGPASPRVCRRRPTRAQDLIRSASGLLDAAWLHEAINVAGAIQEQHPVPGRIRLVPFQLVIRDFDFRSDVDMRPAARAVRPGVGGGPVGLVASASNL